MSLQDWLASSSPASICRAPLTQAASSALACALTQSSRRHACQRSLGLPVWPSAATVTGAPYRMQAGEFFLAGITIWQHVHMYKVWLARVLPLKNRVCID